MNRFRWDILLLTVIVIAGSYLLWSSSPDSVTAENPLAIIRPVPVVHGTNERQKKPIDGLIETPPAESLRMETVIRVTGLKPQPGSLRIAVFESPDGFPKSEQSTKTTVIETNGEHLDFSLSLPVNHPVAIAVFQDLDGNKIISKSSIGIPIEPYGFSNNARGLLGPPTFQQAVVRINEGQDRLEIQVR